MNCVYCKGTATDADLNNAIVHDGKKVVLCSRCRNNPKHKIMIENGHLILRDDEDDRKICLICGERQRFTADGDYEGFRYYAKPCVPK